MAKYTVELTDAEDKAMAYIAYSVKDWIDNSAHNRARKAIDELYDVEVVRMTDDPDIDTIPADKNKVVLDSTQKTAKQRKDEEVARRAAEAE